MGNQSERKEDREAADVPQEVRPVVAEFHGVVSEESGQPDSQADEDTQQETPWILQLLRRYRELRKPERVLQKCTQDTEEMVKPPESEAQLYLEEIQDDVGAPQD